MPAAAPDVSTIRFTWSSEVPVSVAGLPSSKKPDVYSEMSFVEWDHVVEHCRTYHSGTS